MPLLYKISDNQYRKIAAGSDYNKPSGVLKDRVIVINSVHVTTRIVPTGFRYQMNTNELEVYQNGQFLRKVEAIDGTEYGDYTENSDFSVMFGVGRLLAGDIIRFRVTTSSYNEALYSRTSGIDGRLDIGTFAPDNSTPSVIPYRTWKTATLGSFVTITNLLEGIEGQRKFIFWSNSNTVIQNNSNIQLSGGLDFQGNYGDIIQLICVDTAWFETSRSLK